MALLLASVSTLDVVTVVEILYRHDELLLEEALKQDDLFFPILPHFLLLSLQ